MPAAVATSSSGNVLPDVTNDLSVDAMRQRVEERFGIRPCLWQIEVVQAILARKYDIVSVAGTGMGKSLTFWMPILFAPPRSVQIIVTPLNLLGKQGVRSLEKAGLRGVYICAETAGAVNWQAIEDGEYHAVIINPEQMMKDGGPFEELIRKRDFTSRIISLTFDEGHCISLWGSFRPDYKEISRLAFSLTREIPRVVTTATLTEPVLNDIKHTLHLYDDRLKKFHRCNDRPNVHIAVKPIQSSLNSFEDLKFVIGDWKPGQPPPGPFLVFFDDINESIRACEVIRKMLPLKYQDKVVWFNSHMSNQFKEEHVERLAKHDAFGYFASESFGMGLDLSNIKLVVQWRATCTLSTLWQRFGRGGRDHESEATAILLVEQDHFDGVRQERERKKAARLLAKSKNGTKKALSTRPSKRQRVGGSNGNIELTFVPETLASDSEASDSSHDDGSIDSPLRRDAVNSPVSVQQPMKRPNGRGQRRRKRMELEPAMDDFINAKSRALSCRRDPIHVTFKNKEAGEQITHRLLRPPSIATTSLTNLSHTYASLHILFAVFNHLVCDKSRPDGCPRCRPRISRLCCDIHNSPAFRRFAVARRPPARAPAKASIKKYEMDDIDYKLYEALDIWREEKTEKLYGWVQLEALGPMLVMPTTILQRIVDCAHVYKIKSRDDIARETNWDEALRFGDEVLDIVKRIRPPQLSTDVEPEPLAPTFGVLRFGAGQSELPQLNTSRNGSLGIPEKKVIRCSRCHQQGHNARNARCPRYASSSAEKENIDLGRQ